MYGINTGGPGEDDDLMVAIKLMKGCYELYHQTASGVAWDSVWFNEATGGRRRLMSFEGGDGDGSGDSSSAGGSGSSAGEDQDEDQDDDAGLGEAHGGSAAAGDGGGSTSTARRRLQQSGKKRYQFRPRSTENFLRPEVAEALFYLHRATGV